jgi:diguanylate cyclase (GGDEF)-like protein/PAS domain S-box-containing protein
MGRKAEMFELAHRTDARQERALEALRESEGRLRALIDSASTLFAYCDTERRYVFVNEGYAGRFGLNRSDVLGKRIAEVIGEEAYASIRPYADTVLDEGRATEFEADVPYEDIGRRRVHAAYVPDFSENGEVRGLIAVISDVTERRQVEEALQDAQNKLEARVRERTAELEQANADLRQQIEERVRAEEALGESERRLFTLLKNAPAYFYRCLNKPDWPNKYVSDYARELTGHSPEELTNGTIMFGELIVKEDRQRVWDEVQAALAERRRFETRYSIRRKDGALRHVEERGQGLYDGSGGVEAIEGVIYDVTDSRQAETRLQESESRYRALVEHTPVVTYTELVVEETSLSTYVSPQVESLFGYPPEQLNGNPPFWQVLMHPDDRERVLAVDEHVNRTGAPFGVEYRMIHRDGRVVWVRDEAVLVSREEDGTQRWQGVIHDITKRKETEERLRKAEERYRSLVERIPAVIYIDSADETNSALYRSPFIERMLGYSSEEFSTGSVVWQDLLHADDRERVLAENDRTNETGEPFRMEYRLLAKDGRVVWVSDEAVLIRDEGGRPLYWQGVFVDVTERKQAEEALRKSGERFRALTQNASDLLTLLSPDGTIHYKSSPVKRILGYEPEEFVGQSAFDYIHPDDLGYVQKAFSELVADPNLHPCVEYRFLHKDGSWRWLESIGSNLLSDPSVGELVINSRDVTERKGLEERLAHQALHDALTGLPNRSLLVDRIEHALVRAKRRGSKVAALFVDLDDFKVINDSLGHEAGDELLVAVAERLRECLRPEDTLSRLGGDEFVILLEDVAGAGETARAAERIAQELRAPFVLTGRELFVTASVGIAFGDGFTQQTADLLRNADLAMYRAKHTGKARHEVFEKAMNTHALERLEMGNDLRRALERDEFVVHYQPKVLLGTGEIVGFEALVRWEHPEAGSIPPLEFIPLAEETGLIVPIGEVVLEETCRQAQEWQERFPGSPPRTMSVNLSARQFREPGLAKTVVRILEETGLDPSSLDLEITESTAMEDAPSTVATLEELKALGVHLSIDDFGTGYSSMSYLERFFVDYLKIDRSFVSKLGQDEGAAVLVSGVISLAHALGLEVVAEGVETTEQLELLQEMKADLAQGFFFSKPLTAEAVAVLLAGASRSFVDGHRETQEREI